MGLSIRSSRPIFRERTRSEMSLRVRRLRALRRPLEWPRRMAMERFSAMDISAAVPRKGF